MVNELNWRQQSRLRPWWVLLGMVSDEALMCDPTTALRASDSEFGKRLWLEQEKLLRC